MKRFWHWYPGPTDALLLLQAQWIRYLRTSVGCYRSWPQMTLKSCWGAVHAAPFIDIRIGILVSPTALDGKNCCCPTGGWPPPFRGLLGYLVAASKWGIPHHLAVFFGIQCGSKHAASPLWACMAIKKRLRAAGAHLTGPCCMRNTCDAAFARMLHAPERNGDLTPHSRPPCGRLGALIGPFLRCFWPTTAFFIAIRVR